MASLLPVSCPQDEWTKIADNVDEGVATLQTPGTDFHWCYKLHGVAPPTLISHGAPSYGDPQLTISAYGSEKLDVYVWPTNQDCVFMVGLPGLDPPA